MTTFQFPHIFNDSEAMALKHAIDLYKNSAPNRSPMTGRCTSTVSAR